MGEEMRVHNHQMAFYDHMNSLMNLCGSLTEKTAYVNLGPADGKLYMQLCDTLAAYSKGLEETFNGGNEDSGEGPPNDTGPEGDQPPSPA